MSDVKYEGVSFELDAEKIAAAVERLPSWAGTALGDLGLDSVLESIPETTEEFADEAFEIDDGNGSLNFVQSFVIAELLAGQLAAQEHQGNLDIETDDAPLALVHGPLRVDGDLTLSSGLVVLGDLKVSGRIRDFEPFSRLIVIGNLDATTIWARSPIWVSGDAKAAVTHMCLHGQLFVGGELRTELLLESAESRGIKGRRSAGIHSPASIWRDTPREALEQLRAMLRPEAYAVDEERGFFDPEHLLQLAETGNPFLREKKSSTE